jgi:hypothetical protein
MTSWLLTLGALLSGAALVVAALGRLLPAVSLRNRAAAVFYLFAAVGAFLQAWRWGTR